MGLLLKSKWCVVTFWYGIHHHWGNGRLRFLLLFVKNLIFSAFNCWFDLYNKCLIRVFALNVDVIPVFVKRIWYFLPSEYFTIWSNNRNPYEPTLVFCIYFHKKNKVFVLAMFCLQLPYLSLGESPPPEQLEATLASNTLGMTPLHAAAEGGHLQVVFRCQPGMVVSTP